MLQRAHSATRGRLPAPLHRAAALYLDRLRSRGTSEPLCAAARAPLLNLRFLSDAPTLEADSAKDLHAKILQSVETKSCPPNAWIWSLIEKCGNTTDVDLLFQTLENLRRFRLSSLRICTNFNSHLCERVAEACTRADTRDHGLKTLWKHNTYGLTPSVASANHLLKHAKEKNDYKFMGKIMHLLQKNDLPLQPSTADLVFSICSNTNKWDLISLYSTKFINAGVKLHRSTFDTWMEFAASRGDAPSIWKIQELRSKSIKHETLSSALSCAKGFLLEHKPDSAAAIIHAVNQTLPDRKRPNVEPELQKLIGDWPLEVIKRTEGDKKTLARSLKEDIATMMEALTTMGMQVNMGEFKQKLAA